MFAAAHLFIARFFCHGSSDNTLPFRLNVLNSEFVVHRNDLNNFHRGIFTRH